MKLRTMLMTNCALALIGTTTVLGAVSQNPREPDIVIDEETAMEVNESAFGLIGSGAEANAGIYSDVSKEEPNSDPSIHDIKLHVLGQGQTFDLATHRTTNG